MASEVKLPELGEGIETAQVLAVLVSPGDSVQKDQTIIEVETEKATAEVPTEVAGVVESVLVNKGDEIKVGQTIIQVAAGAAAPAAEPEPAPEVKTDPAPQEEPAAPAAPTPKPAPEPEPTPVPEPVPAPKPASTAPSIPAAPPAASPEPEKIVYLEQSSHTNAPAAPSVRRLARELGVPIDQVTGTGEGGRISEGDVKAFARTLINQGASLASVQPAQPAAPASGQPAPPPLPDFSQWGEVERQPLSMVRRATANAMANAWSTVPMVTQFDRADITELEAFRRDYSKRGSVKLTVTAIAAKVAASALKVFPQFNCSLDLAKEEVIQKHYVHVGIAVDTDRGLLVPVLRDVDTKNIAQIAEELGSAAERARERKISLDELKGATFSISNLGGLGTTYFSPIVNWPEVAILGMGRAQTEAVFQDGEFVPRSILPLAVTYDHRVIDGADAARFLRWIAAALEEPMLLAVEG